MNYDFGELTADDVRGVGFRERYRGYDPADVDPLLEQLVDTVEAVHDEIARLERRAGQAPRTKNMPPLDDVVALAAMLHIGYAAREARTIVTTARKRTGITKAKPPRRVANEERARALLYRPTPAHPISFGPPPADQ